MKVSSERGNPAKKRPPKYQDRVAFRHNKNSSTTKKILALPNQGLCSHCHEIVEWKKKYRKYKPLTTKKRCNECGEKAIVHAYHTLCAECSKKTKRCAKCKVQKEIVAKIVTTEEGAAIDLEFETKLKKLRERHRRTVLRNMEKGLLTKEQFLKTDYENMRVTDEDDEFDDFDDSDGENEDDENNDDDDEEEGENDDEEEGDD